MKYILVFFIVTLLYSCNNKPNYTCNRNYNVSLKVTDTAIISLDTISLNSYSIYDYCDNDSLLYNYNNKTHSIDILSLSKDTVVNHIYLQQEGPNGIKAVSGMKVINKDSIFITSENYNTIYLINNNAQIINKFEFNYLEENTTDFIVRSDNIFNAKIYIKNAKMYTYIYSLQENIKNEKIAIEYNMKNNKIEKFYADFPERYKKYYFSSLETPSFIVNNNKTIIAYPNNSYLDVYDNNTGKLLYRKCVKSKYISELEALKKSSDMQSEADFLNEAAYYFALLYDKYNDVYYRICKHKMDLYDNEGMLNNRFSGSSSVIIFDNKLNIIGEQKLPRGLLYPYAFVSNKGLNIYAPTNNEYKMAFICFKLKNIKND